MQNQEKHPLIDARNGRTKIRLSLKSCPIRLCQNKVVHQKASGGRHSIHAQQAVNCLSTADYCCICLTPPALAVLCMPCNRLRRGVASTLVPCSVAHARLHGTTTFVQFSARNLTQKVPFSSTNSPPCRKKSILAEVCLDAKRGWLYMQPKCIFI